MCKVNWNVDCGVWQVYYEKNTSSIVVCITGLTKAEKMSMTMQVNNRTVKKMIFDNRWITTERELADKVGISFGSWQAIFTDVVGMNRTAAKIVPKLQNFKQKQRRMDIAQEMLTTFNDDPDLLKKAITGDESWVYGYDIETKA